jgi:hypothetical protein
MCETVNDEGIVPISCDFPIITDMEDCIHCGGRIQASEVVWQKSSPYCPICASLPFCNVCGDKIEKLEKFVKHPSKKVGVYYVIHTDCDDED